MKKVCVPINSPAWQYYVREGWVTVAVQGTRVILIEPKPEINSESKQDILELN